MSCTDVQTIQAGNGTKTQFSFDFPYIFKSEIHVYFWNATTKEYDEILTDGLLSDDTNWQGGSDSYPWRITDANPTIVEFTGTAPPSPTTPTDPGEPTVDNVKIRRITKVDDIRALFNPGSAIRSDDLNKNFEQLRYAIQEANCAGIPDDVDEYLKNYYWDRYDNTLYDGDTWVSDDTKIATTAALDARFQDEVNDTFTKAELAAGSNAMPDNDNAVPTTGAVDNYINHVLTNDIAGSNGVSITDDGDGTITVGLTDNSVDFDKIKDADQIKLADQVADPDVEGTDNNIFTARAATRRFNNYYQNDAPATTDGVGIGQIWVDPNDDLTLSVWSGSNWVGVTSGGTFTNQPKVIYVDANSGDDTNDGHRISRPKKTIAAALSDINSDSVYGDGSIVSVAPGIYAETLPLDIQKNDVGIIGQSLRTCIIHPKIPAADQPTYDVDTPHSQELQTMFRVNSGSYFTNLTLTGLKASGTRGGNSLYTDSTYGLPTNQGWNFGFYPNAVIKKSPYIQNVTNFSDSQINNVNFTPHTPGEGAAGDLDSAPTGGGILIDGSVPDTSSPLRSMVCDSYTHTALDGPGIFVTNNGYAQCTSSYAFFNHAHITCVNGGQANLAASTTDFGRFGLVADGKSSTAIFTSNVDGAASSGDTTFNINAPTAASGWFGSATRPANNMLVTVNSVTYPVLSATSYTDSEGGSGWTVTISRPDPSDTATNLGLNGAVSDDSAVSFFLRSMIASSGHTMEYVGSGTDYTALPENGGVPIDANQIKELNDGKVWAATTDHKGTFKLGDFFTVDQQAGSLTVNSGSFQVDLGTLNVNVGGQAEVGADLDMGANELTSSTGDLKLQASGDINVQTNKIINVTDPTAAQDAATKAYVDNNTIGEVVDDASPQLGGNLDVNGYEILSTGNGDITINPNGTGDIVLDANVGIGETAPAANLVVKQSGSTFTTASQTVALFQRSSTTGHAAKIAIVSGNAASSDIHFGDTDDEDIGMITYSHIDNSLRFTANASEAMRIDSSGRLLMGASSTSFTTRALFQGSSSGTGGSIFIARNQATPSDGAALGTIFFGASNHSQAARIGIARDGGTWTAGSSQPSRIEFATTADGASSPTERMRIDSSGNVGIGESTPTRKLHVAENANNDVATFINSDSTNGYGVNIRAGGTASGRYALRVANDSNTVVLQANADGNVGIGTTSPGSYDSSASNLVVGSASGDEGITIAAGTSSSSTINFADGTSGSAAYTGRILYQHSANALTLHTNGGLERMRIDNSGNVLINTTTLPTSDSKLTVENSGSSCEFNVISGASNGSVVNMGDTDDYNDGRIKYDNSTRSMQFQTANAERLRIDSSGNLLIGSTTASDHGDRLLQVGSTSRAATYISIVNSTSGTGGLLFADTTSNDTGGYRGQVAYSHSDDAMQFWTGATERMRITSSGAFKSSTNGTYDNTSSTSHEFNQTNASVYALRIKHSGTTPSGILIDYSAVTQNDTGSSFIQGEDATTFRFRFASNGGLYNYSGNDSNLCDEREKKNIETLDSTWGCLKNWELKKFHYNEDADTDDKRYGVIAQQVQQHCPEVISDWIKQSAAEAVLDGDGNVVTPAREEILRKGVKEQQMMWMAIKALQEAQDRIETLEAKVAALEAE